MSKLTNMQKILLLLSIIIVVAGAIITVTIGLNFDLRYENAKKVELNLQSEFNIADVKTITDEVLPGQDVLIQKVELYEDTVSIIAKEITEEQRNTLVEKINEKYGTEITTEETEILSIPHTRGRDIIKPYIMPFIIATLIIIIYMAIKYHKLNSLKVIAKTIILSIWTELVLLGIMAITRIPIGRLTIPLVIIVYMITLLGLTSTFEKQLTNLNKEQN